MQRTSTEREWLDLVADLLEAPGAPDVEQRVCHQLRSTFELPRASHYRSGPEGARVAMWPTGDRFGGHRGEIERWSAREATTAHPVLRYYLATGDARPVRVEDVPDAVVDRRGKARWFDLGRHWGAPHQLPIPVHLSAGAHRAYCVGREDPFTTGELALADTLHRLLRVLDRHTEALRAVAPPASSPLSPRELAVLGLVAQGLTAAAVARRLLVAERTVHKHLQRAYVKLGVHDRLGAVLTAQRIGLLPR